MEYFNKHIDDIEEEDLPDIPQKRQDDFRLSPRQSSIYKALKEKSQELSNIFGGGLRVLRENTNPERIFQSAHSLRELLDKIPRYWEGTPVITKSEGQTGMKNKVDNLEPFWEKAKGKYSNDDEILDWSGEIESSLRKFLRKFDEFLIWKENNRAPRRKEAGKFLKNEAPLPDYIPNKTKSEKERTSEWMDFHTYFASVAHHDKDTRNFNNQLNNLEEYLSNEVLFVSYPVVFEDLNLLDSLISKGESND